MGKYQSSVFFIIFLLGQFFQGAILNNFLRRETDDVEQWWWLLADGLLVLFWLVMMYNRRQRLVVQDMPFIPLPTMATAWGIYLLVVFIPRVSWLMRVAGTCLGETEPRSSYDASSNSTRMLEEQLSFGLLSAIGWGANTLTTLLAVGSTAMFLFLVMSGYGQHGLVANAPLDFDMAEAAFCMMDGVEFLGAFFEVGDVGQCEQELVVQVTSQPQCNQSIESDVQVYIDAIEGSFGGFVITLAVACFVLPFFALWQFKRRSTIIKANQTLRKDARLLSRDSVTSSLQGGSSLSLDRSLTSQSSTEQIKAAGSRPSQLSVVHLDLLGLQNNVKAVERMEKELSVLKVVYILWDMVVINLAGAVVRFLLWFKFNRPISALITKNILAVIFRSLNLINDYAVPWYQSRWGDEDIDAEMWDDSRRSSMPTFSPVLSFRRLVKQNSTFSPATANGEGHTNSNNSGVDLAPIEETESEIDENDRNLAALAANEMYRNPTADDDEASAADDEASSTHEEASSTHEE